MTVVKPSSKLTYAGARKALDAAVAAANAMGAPQDIAVVDASGHLLAFARMDGARTLSILTSQKKAITAANFRAPTGGVPSHREMKLAMATDGRLTNLEGGLPIIIDGECVGAIGVGSGTPEQDVEVARAALRAIGAEER
jgi:uncharacterized protein GlcG (DUF336 family)